MRKITAIVIFLMGIWGLYSFNNNQEFKVFKGSAIGTYYSIKIADEINTKQINDVILSEIDNVNNKMSCFKTTSELSNFNNLVPNEWFKVSDDLFEVLLKARDVFESSNGAFDVTVGDLVDLWGFGTKNKGRVDIPSSQEIAAAKKTVGFNLIDFDSGNKSIRKKANSKINLSAIAKGDLVDKIALHFDNLKINNYIVEIGGETKVKGYRNPKNKEKWRIGIEKPDANQEGILRIVAMHNMSVATSGDYRNFFDYNGKRYSHTINPKTGFPVTHNIVSASVFNESCMTADAYATAILALGKDDALKWIADNKIPVILYFAEENDKFEEYVSDKAKEILNEL
ncbi:MAG: FAD:protein FMN transferase [Alphaproteobacteria bacterium]